uniref:Retrovirus-related Pol polyprotein from transposon 412 family n=1 Tax=Cajanus cajan TaxID=3821 RepID=A0A151SQC3_CAJCA|nr:Retrovirus-related Pol polyprotein from transposon 412 family [Cajanus cajan]
MVVKSDFGQSHTPDLQELFDTINKYHLKLNPDKCSFGVKAVKFLGFLLSHRGIEANLERCAAVINMRSPQNVKEVQQLTGRIISLSRFVARIADKAIPFFQCLKKNEKFRWTEECEKAFCCLKESLGSPPVLSKPIEGYPLLLYAAVSDQAMSTTLVQDITDKDPKTHLFCK